MKKGHTYEINFQNKTVIITKAFEELATQFDNDEFKLLLEFEKMGLRIVRQKRKSRKPVSERKPLLTYKAMRDYLAYLDDGEEMTHDFDTLCASAKTRGDRLQYVNNWFFEQCPRYYEVPEMNEHGAIVHNPNPASRKLKAIA